MLFDERAIALLASQIMQFPAATTRLLAAAARRRVLTSASLPLLIRRVVELAPAGEGWEAALLVLGNGSLDRCGVARHPSIWALVVAAAPDDAAKKECETALKKVMKTGLVRKT